MAQNFGSGVSRVLDPDQSNIVQVIWQQGKPPLDSELNLIQQLDGDWRRILVLRGTPSGWLGNALDEDQAFLTNSAWSNWFRFGNQNTGEKRTFPWAVVNGWLIPVTGTFTGSPPGSPNDTDTWNRITLPPPPSNSGDTRIDFVFLEAWLARVPPNPAVTNKPSSSALWRYGNVEGGYTFLADDIQDPAIGFETTQRIQLQYRIRVVQGLVGLSSYPDGFDPTVVKGQGAAAAVTSYVFSNMRQELGDPGLWRAGDGSSNALGTVDGYTYAIPLAALFRRNSVAWDGDPSQNLNGAFNRNPTAVDRTGYKTFVAATLAGDISASVMNLALSTATNIPLPLTPATAVTIQIGDEILTYSVITGTNMTLTQRGAFGSKAETHRSGDAVIVLSGRPDGLFSDQIAKTDILDLRHTVNPGGFDYASLLKGNLDKVFRGQLRSTWKRAGSGVQGPYICYQSKVSAAPAGLGVTKLDGPDGIRQVWGNPSLLQPVIIPLGSPQVANPALPIGGTLGNSFSSVVINHPGGVAGFQPGDIITVPKSLFTTGLPGADVDQVRLIADQDYATIRFIDEVADLNIAQYSLAEDGSGNLVITLAGGFVPRNVGAFLTMHVLYGPGRGLDRRPDAIHSVAYLSASPNLALQLAGVPSDNQPMRTTWAPLWSKYRGAVLNDQLPTTSEAYADLGSGTVMLTPFRRQTFVQINSLSNLITVQKPASATTGAMPANTPLGAPKWATVDPLDLFSSHLDPTPAQANMVVILPRMLMPGFGAMYSPILHTDSGNVDQGINFGIYAPKGAVGAEVSNYIPMLNGATSFAVFSTLDLNTDLTVTYNTAFTFGVPIAGMRFFTDSRALGRAGLELPPYYVAARLWAVYEAQDYKTNGSSFNATTREPDPVAGATNLLRQNFDGPTFWIESDVDGDPTYILNAEAIDIARSPNPIASFSAGHYVIEASIMGCDRGAFELSSVCKIVLTRDRTEGLTDGQTITNPEFLLPGAPELGDEVVVNYSREPYQGDAWGSQGSSLDSPQYLGPMTSANRYQISSTNLDYEGLTRPNEKVLEVVAGMAFLTTLGTGRLSGDVPASDADFRVAAYEPWSLPTSAVDPRPTLTLTALAGAERYLTVGTEYLGATTRLPLGALWRDKDFRGNAVGGPTGDLRQLISGVWYSPATMLGGLAPTSNSELNVLPVYGASQASGNAGEIVVHVDGSQGNYSLLTNYRTTRGGSAFTASGSAGGDLAALLPGSELASTSGGVLSGLALLVRCTPTSIGAQEVSAGSELMLLITTTAKPQNGSGNQNVVQIGTTGTGEGYSACDLYRLAGKPLIRGAATSLDPSTVDLARRTTLL